MGNKCFSCEKRKKKYITGLCERCNKTAIDAIEMSKFKPAVKEKLAYNLAEVAKFAKRNAKRPDDLGALARAFLDLQADLKMADSCMQKADMWLSRAMG